MSRLPLAASVVGALLVGGAVTGSTHASWVSEKPLNEHSVASGAMSVAGSASPASLTLDRGASGTVVVTVTDTSTTAAKNLRQQITPSVASGPAGVTTTLTTRVNGACTTTAQPAVTTLPGGSFTSCLNITATSTASSGTVVVSLPGAQVPSGWSSSASVSVPVTINNLAAPTISCAGPTSNTFSWPAVSGATGYIISSSSASTGPYTDVASQTTLSYTATASGNSTTYWRVRATNSAGASAPSNVLQITRSGSLYTCTAALL